MDSYDAYMADLHQWIAEDQDTRLTVLDAAAAVEMEIYAIVAMYLGGGDNRSRDVVEHHVATWGPLERPNHLLSEALGAHDAGPESDAIFSDIRALFRTRNLIAHGRVETWHANHPEFRDGELGRQIYKRSRSGDASLHWISFGEAREQARAARNAVADLGRRIAAITPSY